MTRPFDPSRLQFYLTMPSPCPYLPGLMERKIFTQLDPINGPHLNNYLTHVGFRRSQNVIYRPACEDCQSCQSLRIVTEQFNHSYSTRRIMKKNSDLTIENVEPIATSEQFALLQSYLHVRHPDGGMADMDLARYEMMVEDCAAQTEIVEYRQKDGTLIACTLIDCLMDGLSMVYSFFDTEAKNRSLGNFMILDHINQCQMRQLPYLYLGYWVKDSPKMAYKSRFKPCEILTRRSWQRLEAHL